MIEAVPEPGQRLPVQKHHEVRQYRVAVYAARSDLPHQVHTHRVAAERKKGRMSETQDAAISPDEIDGHRQHRITQILPDEDEAIRGKMNGGRRRNNLVEDR